MWIKNTSGRKDAMLTFAALSFLVVTLNVLLSSVGEMTCPDGAKITFQAIGGDVMAVYLGATFSAYVSRRWTDSAYVAKAKKQEDKDETNA